MGQLMRLASYVGPFKKQLTTAIVIMTVASALSMLQPIFMKNVMDTITETNFQHAVIHKQEAIRQDSFQQCADDGSFLYLCTHYEGKDQA
jgi:ATP-binding cassette subfamily B protein